MARVTVSFASSCSRRVLTSKRTDPYNRSDCRGTESDPEIGRRGISIRTPSCETSNTDVGGQSVGPLTPLDVSPTRGSADDAAWPMITRGWSPSVYRSLSISAFPPPIRQPSISRRAPGPPRGSPPQKVDRHASSNDQRSDERRARPRPERVHHEPKRKQSKQER